MQRDAAIHLPPRLLLIDSAPGSSMPRCLSRGFPCSLQRFNIPAFKRDSAVNASCKIRLDRHPTVAAPYHFRCRMQILPLLLFN